MKKESTSQIRPTVISGYGSTYHGQKGNGQDDNAGDYEDAFKAANTKVFGDLSTEQLSQKYKSTREVTEAWYNALFEQESIKQGGGDEHATGVWDIVGRRARVFYP